MMRFLVISTMLRGALAQPEPLDEENQGKAFSRWYQDVNSERRVHYEPGQICWNDLSASTGRSAARRI